MNIRMIAALAATVALGACTPYGLGPQISSFRQSVAESQKSLDEGLVAFRREALSRQAASLVSARAPIQMSPGCVFSSARDRDGVMRAPCTIMRQGDPDPITPGVIANEPATRRQMAVLLRYVSGLEAVSNAADSKALTAATNDLAGAASALPAAAAPAGPAAAAAATAAGAAIGAAVQLGGTFARIALDYERLAALRRAVDATQEPVRVVATGIGTSLEALRIARYEQVFGEADDRAERVGGSPASSYSGAYEGVQNRVSAANALREGDGNAVGRGIASAHDKLVLAANDSSAGAVEFARAVGELADAVDAFRKAMAALGAASTPGT